jgi:hypothetical protein
MGDRLARSATLGTAAGLQLPITPQANPTQRFCTGLPLVAIVLRVSFVKNANCS